MIWRFRVPTIDLVKEKRQAFDEIDPLLIVCTVTGSPAGDGDR
jgi:hypothetical protein